MATVLYYIFWISVAFLGLCGPARSADFLASTPGFYSIEGSLSGGNERLRIAIPLSTVEDLVVATAEKGMVKDSKFRIRITKFAFDQTVSLNVFKLDVNFDAEHGELRERGSCAVSILFGLPAARFPDFKPQLNGDPYVRCEVSGLIAKLFEDQLRREIQRGIADAFAKLPVANNLLNNADVSNDSLLKAVLVRAYAQGQRCQQADQASLCISVAWSGKAITDYIAELVGRAPHGSRPASMAELPRLIAFWTGQDVAPRRDSTKVAGYRYPAEKQVDHFGDGDMTIFGGLLCIAGENEGCTLVERSQGANGQWFRAPDRVGEIPDIEKGASAQFSGDQFKGTVAYFVNSIRSHQKGDPRWIADRDRFLKWLQYIKETKVALPSAKRQVASGHLSCTIPDVVLTCLLGGWEWAWLNRLAAAFDVSHAIPSDQRDPYSRYGYRDDIMEVEAAIYPLGYRMHLVGVQVLLERAFSDDRSKLQRVASILASRQPNNPFFLFLHLGADEKVMQELLRKCRVNPAAVEKNEWAWQRGEYQEAWKNTMVWDCVFMARQLNK